jgi:hypothetical protein
VTLVCPQPPAAPPSKEYMPQTDPLAARTQNVDIVSPKSVFHVGTLIAKHRKQGNLEGPHLAVSRCPKAWTQIARLGGGAVWKLRKTDAKLLLMPFVGQAPRNAIAAWGVREGLLQNVDVCSPS